MILNWNRDVGINVVGRNVIDWKAGYANVYGASQTIPSALSMAALAGSTSRCT